MSVRSQIVLGWRRDWLRQSVSSSNRSASVLSGGTFHATLTWLTVVDATPPTPFCPWQFAHCSETAALYSGLAEFANRTAPRATAFLSK